MSLALQMWALLLLAFAIGVATGLWMRPPRRAPRPVPHQAADEPAPALDPGGRMPPMPLAPAAGPPDDLTAIRGIGPHYEKVLKEAGLSTYRQMAALDKGQIAWLEERLAAGDRIEREDWPGQAKALLRGR